MEIDVQALNSAAETLAEAIKMLGGCLVWAAGLLAIAKLGAAYISRKW